ncbi:hypothetical protein D3C87_2160920 [compost metagenome]
MALENVDSVIDGFIVGCIHQAVVVVLGQFAQAHRGQVKAQEAFFFIELDFNQAQQLLV